MKNNGKKKGHTETYSCKYIECYMVNRSHWNQGRKKLQLTSLLVDKSQYWKLVKTASSVSSSIVFSGSVITESVCLSLAPYLITEVCSPIITKVYTLLSAYSISFLLAFLLFLLSSWFFCLLLLFSLLPLMSFKFVRVQVLVLMFMQTLKIYK